MDKNESRKNVGAVPGKEADNLPKLSKSDVSKACWNWQFFSHANYNYERLRSPRQ